MLRQGMGAHFHRSDPTAGISSLRQLGLKPIGKCRGVHRCDAVAGPAVHQGAEQRCGLTGFRGQMFDQVRCRGFSIGAGHTDQPHASARLIPERRCQGTDQGCHRLWHHHHRVKLGWRVRLRSHRADHCCHSAGRHRLPPEPAAVDAFTGKPQKQTAGANGAGITGHRVHDRVVEPCGDSEINVPEQCVE